MNNKVLKVKSPASFKGFTLVELIVVIGIISLLIAMTLGVYLNFRQSADQQLTSQLILQMDARRAADILISQIRQGSEVVRPHAGETTPFLILKDAVNNISLIYLDGDQHNSTLLKRPVYRMVAYTDDYSGVHNPKNEKILLDSIVTMSFSAIGPGSVQLSVTLAGDRQDYQFITHLGLMNLGQ